jgi:hypothetical protein
VSMVAGSMQLRPCLHAGKPCFRMLAQVTWMQLACVPYQLVQLGINWQ